MYFQDLLQGNLKEKLDEISIRIDDNLDIDFSHVSKNINTIKEFNQFILDPFLSGEKLFIVGSVSMIQIGTYFLQFIVIKILY